MNVIHFTFPDFREMMASGRLPFTGRALRPDRSLGVTTTSQSTATGYRVLNPATGEVVEQFPTATDEQIQDALAAAHGAFQSWKEVPIEERAKVVARVGNLFTERADELAAIIPEEMGKPLSQSKGEAEFCTDIFNYFATEGPALAADQPIKPI